AVSGPMGKRGPAGSLLPGNSGFARRKRPADVVGNLLRKRRVGVNRPAAEIERVDVLLQAREAGFRKTNLAPSEPRHSGELRRFELDRGKTGCQRLVEPHLDALIEHRVELVASKRLQTARV